MLLLATFGGAVTTVVVIFLIIAVCLGLVESQGGFLGDSSMVPGVLIVGILVVAAMALVGWWGGYISVTVK